jgi:hypothetical protein
MHWQKRMVGNQRDEAAIRSNSSFLATAYELTSPAAALLISEMIP